MKKIGVILGLFGFFFPIILSLYTTFPGDPFYKGYEGIKSDKGFSFKNIKLGYVGEIVIRDAIYYTDEEYKKVNEEYKKEERVRRDEIRERIKKGEKFGGIALYGLEDPISNASRIKKPAEIITINYVDCLAGSIIILAIGLGFLLLSKKPANQKKGGETEKI